MKRGRMKLMKGKQSYGLSDMKGKKKTRQKTGNEVTKKKDKFSYFERKKDDKNKTEKRKNMKNKT